MRAVDIICRKRDGHALNEHEITYMIDAYMSGEIPDYQMSAWAMAIFFQGMNAQETVDLTIAMIRSGQSIDLSTIQGVKVDKHSTGGVGDTTTLILAPLVASCGVPVAKMSGRGLGHSGGTIDKLDSFSGFSVEMDTNRFIELVNRHHLAVMSQSSSLTPADQKLYALRDVTGTVNSIPLIASSIMSKKMAAGADAICLDVKTGSGAFMKDLPQARELAKRMVEIGSNVGRQTVALISDMNQPLGHAVGNILEVKEAIETLHGQGPSDLTELCLALGSHMLVQAGRVSNHEQAKELLQSKLDNGQALQKMAEFIGAQGGDAQFVYRPDLFPQAAHRQDVYAQRTGYVLKMDSEEIGRLAMVLGAGRMTKDTVIDLRVGLIVHKKLGDFVHKGQLLATLHTQQENNALMSQHLQSAITLGEQPISPPPLIYEQIISGS